MKGIELLKAGHLLHKKSVKKTIVEELFDIMQTNLTQILRIVSVGTRRKVSAF